MKNAFLLYACFLISAMPACRQQPAPAETPSGEISLKEYFRPAESGIQTGGGEKGENGRNRKAERKIQGLDKTNRQQYENKTTVVARRPGRQTRLF